MRNAEIKLKCVNCDKWRLLFGKKKLPPSDKQWVEEILQSVEYTCGLMMGKLILSKL